MLACFHSSILQSMATLKLFNFESFLSVEKNTTRPIVPHSCFNDLVLSRIFSFLPFSSLVHLRRVSIFWFVSLYRVKTLQLHCISPVPHEPRVMTTYYPIVTVNNQSSKWNAQVLQAHVEWILKFPFFTGISELTCFINDKYSSLLNNRESDSALLLLSELLNQNAIVKQVPPLSNLFLVAKLLNKIDFSAVTQLHLGKLVPPQVLSHLPNLSRLFATNSTLQIEVLNSLQKLQHLCY